MRQSWLIWTTGLACAALMLTGSPVDARDQRGALGDLFSYIRTASPKGELTARTLSLGERVRRAERDREISRSEGDRLQDRLDRVRSFLRDDRRLTRDEFKRRDEDLDRIERDLERRTDRRDRNRDED
jgi:hypothetical protein